MSHPLVYELNTRCWLRDLSAQAGKVVTLGNVPVPVVAEWERLGFTHVWLMGAWEVGPRVRAVAQDSEPLLRACLDALPDGRPEDVAGSPYAVAGYRVPRALGGDSGLKRFRRQLNQHGIGLLLDFIPNHVGLDHPWVRSFPTRFVAVQEGAAESFEVQTDAGGFRLAHGRDPNFPAWRDTVQLDYRRAETRAAMLAELQSVTARCDGVRCDLAMLVLNDVFARTWAEAPIEEPVPAREFWGEAIALAKREAPESLFLAEAYWGLEAQLQNLGFDYTYDKRLYDCLVARDHPAAQHYLLRQAPEFTSASAHFLENHDEPRIATLLSPTEHRAAAWLMLGLPGLRLLHEGQLAGACVRTPVQLERRLREVAQPEIEALYHQFLGALRRSAVGTGEAHLLVPRAAWSGNSTWQNFVVVQWQALANAFDLVVVNLAPHRSQCYVPLAVSELARVNWRMQDLLGDERYERFGEDLLNQGLYLDVGPGAAQLFHFEPS